jgi:hypothetical protein
MGTYGPKQKEVRGDSKLHDEKLHSYILQILLGLSNHAE